MTDLPGLSRYPPGFDPRWARGLGTAEFQEIARTADVLGYDAISVPEHIVMPGDMAPLMNAYWPHALTAMAFAAGATERIRVNSSVVVLPLHDPLHVAKQIATLDVLSSGRAMLAVGSGHTAGEDNPRQLRTRQTQRRVELVNRKRRVRIDLDVACLARLARGGDNRRRRVELGEQAIQLRGRIL